MTGSTRPLNVADALGRAAERAPRRTAVVYPSGRSTYRSITFGALHAEAERLGRAVHRLGIGRDSRVLLMVPPGAEMLALAFGILRAGAILVLIDPGMGRRNLFHCIAEVGPDALVAVPVVHALSRVYRGPFARVRHRVTVGHRWFWGGPTLPELRAIDAARTESSTTADDVAAIAYTSGSTGIPKGVVYRHGMLEAQLASLEGLIEPAANDVALSAFPPFGLLALAMGTTSVFPRMDITRPARVDPREILSVVDRDRVTCAFGSPAVWHRLAEHCVPRGVRLPIRRVLMAGATAPAALLERLSSVLPDDAVIQTPYGATEAMPVTSITAREILAETAERTRQGGGICVGRPLPGITLRIITITDDAIPAWTDGLVLPPGEIGEIAVRGAIVTTEYDRRPAETARAKIADADGGLWHRMGDVGYIDDIGRVWFCGRKSHRVTTAEGTLFTDCCEAIFNEHPDVFRSALVGVGPRERQRPVIVIEPRPVRMPRDRAAQSRMIAELLALGGRHDITQSITDVLFHPSFPVDVRHNAKIAREKLAPWAARRLGAARRAS
ncbi:MAG: AMP-binding protein [Candidatus Rokubacteria bacterium]|nr:AMP-binding protein [Candidatus Rokubacteria bacterium]